MLPFVAAGEARGVLAETLTALSPAGYFRWCSKTAQLAKIQAKLGEMRRLAALRPAYIRERLPSLLELRQQFALALLIGDRDAANTAIRAIDHHQLDSAINTQLMRVRLRDHFRDYEAIVADPLLETLIRARMPQAMREAIVRAFYKVVVQPLEEIGELERAVEAYAERAHPLIGGLLEFCQPADGPEILRTLAHRARHRNDVAAARTLLNEGGDALWLLLAPLLESPSPSHETASATHESTAAPPTTVRSIGSEWHDALSRGDIRRLQSVGSDLLAGAPSDLSTFVRSGVPTVLRQTLEELPNEALRQALDDLSRREGGGETILPVLPQNWPAFLDRLRQKDWSAALRFLRSTERPMLDAMGESDFAAVVEALEELLTDPALRMDVYGMRVLAEALPVFVEEFVSEQQFPRPRLTQLYTLLLRLWSDVRRGSTFGPDGQVMLVLAAAILESPERDEREVSALVRGWWDARPVPALLPYAVEGVELLATQLADSDVAQGLWIDAAELVRRDAAQLSPGERRLWRHLGARIGIDAGSVSEFLGPESANLVAEHDLLTDVGFQKIAIVSLHERAAHEAKKILEERTNAHILVVAEYTAGSGTRSASTADAILFVWSANKHAVYRAFDGARDRLVHVQGTGAGSIVLALERWAAARRQLASV